MKQGGGWGGNKGEGLFVLFVVISVELLTVQSCLLKEVFGNNCIGRGRTLTSSCYRLKGLQLLSSIYSDRYGNFSGLWKGWAPTAPTGKAHLKTDKQMNSWREESRDCFHHIVMLFLSPPELQWARQVPFPWCYNTHSCCTTSVVLT